MAPRRRPARKLPRSPAPLPTRDNRDSLISLSEVDKIEAAAHQLAFSRSEDAIAARAALPKEEQHEYLAGLRSAMEAAASLGDYEAENILMSRSDYFDRLLLESTSYERFVQRTVERLKLLGHAEPDIEGDRRYSRLMAEKIFECWDAIRITLQSRGADIQSRWSKMTRPDRKEILLKAWPNMPQIHRPDLAYFFKTGDLSIKGIDFNKFDGHDLEIMALPYINLEDLLKPNALLIFLNSRGQNHPSSFAHSDIELAPLYKEPKEFVKLFSKSHTMAFKEHTHASNYGSWFEWQDEIEASDSIKAGRTVHYVHGLQILNIQSSIMDFLTRCVAQILEGKEGHKSTSALPGPMSLPEQEGRIQETGIIAREAPYRLPCHLDLIHLRTLISAQRSQAIDHAWALREAPDYFAATVTEYRQHRPELVLDKFGNMHPHASDFPLYNRAVRHMAADAHCLVFVWDELLQRIQEVQHLMSFYSADISRDRDLPEELHNKLTRLRNFLERVLLDALVDLRSQFSASPPVRQYHYRANPHDPNLRMFDIQFSETASSDVSLFNLRTLITVMCDNTARECFSLHALLDEFEYLMQEDPCAKAFVSTHIAKSFSTAAVLAECLNQLHLFQPWACRIEHDMQEHKYKFAFEYDTLMSRWGRIHSVCRAFEDQKLCELCSPRDGKFVYPVQEQPSRAKVEKMRSAEAALDAFWNAANAHWLKFVGTTPSALVKHIMGERTLLRTQPWIATSKPPALRKGLKAPIETYAVPFAEESHDTGKQITGNYSNVIPPTKIKCKTKGVATTQSVVESTLNPLADPATPIQPVLKVNKRSLKVFRSLFHSPNSHNQPGEIAWTDLLHAMISVGFGVKKLRSSAWHFTPPPLISERSIQLHEPHPSNKLPFVLARHYGRRLKIAYQWTIDSFELA